ncbi:hypothetical protein GXW78_17385 [Roseomonas terrae]|uniref:Uncharacterized protein n=1 Tax=Neoroseomonas terrae TaxID=424799 RepID=A0ABS5ELG6_9PROT|nr:hypothetical protein [Neoroseomonas terrae]MBR0651447.1 hypothetical protein [Neoroseomonas terrae]
MIKGDALYFMLSAVLAGVIGAGIWSYNDTYSPELKMTLAVNGVVSQDR